MKTLIPILLFIFCAAAVSAQVIGVNSTLWVGSETSCATTAYYSISTNDGGILFVGTTNCYTGGGDIPPNFPDVSGASAGNVVIGKIDSNMNVSWVRVYGGSQLDAAYGVVQTPDGGYAVLATTYSNDHDVSGNHGTGDLWLLKTDGGGNLLWQKCYGSAYDEQAIAIALAPDSGFIFYGTSNGMGGDVPDHYSGSEFDYDWFVVKTDNTGAIQWTKTIGGTGDENFYGNILVANGGYYLVSSSASKDHDCTDTAWHPGVHYTDYDYYVFKLDVAGNILWDRSYGGAGGDQVYNAIWDNRDSSLVITGTTASTDFMVTGNHSGLGDMWVIKTDKDGTLKWEKCLGNIKNDVGTGITIAPNGYIAYGSTWPGSIGMQDNWAFAIDKNGNTTADKLFGGTGYEWPTSIVAFKDGYAATGHSSSIGFTEGVNTGHIPNPTEAAFITYIISWPLDVQKVNISNVQLTIQPNPANAIVKIGLPNKEGGTITITNCIGEQLYNKTSKQGEANIEINTGEWAKGIYIVQAIQENGYRAVKKIVVQ